MGRKAQRRMVLFVAEKLSRALALTVRVPETAGMMLDSINVTQQTGVQS